MGSTIARRLPVTFALFATLLALFATPANAVSKHRTVIKLTSPSEYLKATWSPKTTFTAQVHGREKKARFVHLQQKKSSKWVDVAKTKSDAAGRVTKTLNHTKAGKHTYRWRVSSTKKSTGAYSKAITVNVFQFNPNDPPRTIPKPPMPPVPVTPPAPSTPQPTEKSFSFVVIGDTQAEVLSDNGNKAFVERTKWIADNKAKENVKYVLHTGDLVNWGWLDKPQFTRAAAALQNLTSAGVRYQASVGNHDGRAVGWNGVEGSRGYGGSAYMYNPECPERLGAAACHSAKLVRDTREFNEAINARNSGGFQGVFEAGKVDNTYSTFTAGGKKWLVLNLELWPRDEVVAWAKTVVANNPTHNIIVQTHSYLNGSSGIEQSNGGYGKNSPQHLWTNVLSKYPNVKMVFSGHVGTHGKRTDMAGNNKVIAFLGNNANAIASTRVVTVNTETGAISSKLFIGNNTNYNGTPTATTSDSGFTFVG